jgi:hypothetical protein
MPAYGLIPDSPWIYYAGKALRRIKSSGSGRAGRIANPFSGGADLKFSGLVIYKPILNFELNSSRGIVGRHLHRTANRITQLAKLQVGKKTGRLRASIRFEHITRSPLGPRVKVGGYTRYALMHHEGTKPHIITPNKPGGNLIFMKGSRVIVSKIVRHPGTRPNRYLTTPMKRVVLSSR